MDTKYLEWVKLLSEVVDEKKATTRKANDLQDIERDILGRDDANMFPTKVSDHAMAQIHKRLEELAHKSKRAYEDILLRPADESLLMASNLECFILAMVGKAYEDETYKSKKSRGGGIEYIYNINMSKWKTDDKELFFTVIVENSNVKTGYFNLVDKK